MNFKFIKQQTGYLENSILLFENEIDEDLNRIEIIRIDICLKRKRIKELKRKIVLLNKSEAIQ